MTKAKIENFTAKQAEAIMIKGGKLDKQYSRVSGENYSKKAQAIESKIAANDAQWEEIADNITKDHKNYKEICFTGFLDS
jgi:hypothetical protein